MRLGHQRCTRVGNRRTARFRKQPQIEASVQLTHESPHVFGPGMRVEHFKSQFRQRQIQCLQELPR